MKYTIQQFRNDYPNENACLDKVFKLRYADITDCPVCCEPTSFRRISTRRCYQCTKCYYQIFPCAGTVFEKSRTPLMYWFYLMFLFTASKNGISAYEAQRQLGVTYKTAWRMLKQIRILISFNKDDNPFEGIVQCDETFVGGKNKNRHADKKVKNSQGRSFKDKTPVMGMVNQEGKVKVFVIPNTQVDILQPLIQRNIKEGSLILSDEWMGYTGISNKNYKHQFVNHKAKEYYSEGVTTNKVENLWSVLKRTLHGSYISVSKKYLQNYVDEVAFRFNNRLSPVPIFDCLLKMV